MSLLLGLLISVVGLENPAGAPRWTFGNADLMGGIPLIPLMIGMFAVSEILRFAVVVAKPVMATDRPFGNVFAGMGALLKKYPLQLFRGSALGTLVGALPGAGADIAAWMSYAMSKRFSKEPAEVRHRPCRGHRRIGRGQQRRAGRRVDSRAGVRHPGRFDHRHRHRRAVPEGHEPGADAVRQQPAEHLCGVHRLHPGASC